MFDDQKVVAFRSRLGLQRLRPSGLKQWPVFVGQHLFAAVELHGDIVLCGLTGAHRAKAAALDSSGAACQ
ncbi:hypothetical protein RD00_13985 [Pseudomonas amygdali pv. tabaci]|nr:hypothetical protein RD00_13985 [Pseudomonas amygdali pv. tabaci]